MAEHRKKDVFIEGPISTVFIGQSIASHSSKTNIGAHSIFLGQVRNDEVENEKVVAIEYTAYREMAEALLHQIREETFGRFDIHCLHVYHSLGLVKAGQISLFVFASSTHRTDAMEATMYIVSRLKKEVPVWGREILTNEQSHWKKPADTN
jgi:molybdopterin synthase catalytic subunit